MSAPETRHGSLGLVHLAVADADRAMRFFGDLFGWVGHRYVADTVSWYTLNTTVTVRLIADPAADYGVRPNYVVGDVATAVAAIEANGGRVTASDASPGGEGWAFAVDAAGVPLVVFRPSDDDHPTSDSPVTGDVGLVFLTEDAASAAGFYGPVLGWDLRRSGPESHYYDAVDRVGVFDAHAAPGPSGLATVTLFVEVPALRPARARILDLGGTAEALPAAPDMGPYHSVRGTDDQGTAFALMALALDPPDQAGPAP